MENITKALLIAGGILFAILVLTLLVIFYNQISAYYAEQHNAKMIEQITEFNNKFENYSGKTIRGNELISVMNKVVDYNRTYSDMEGNERITISVDLKGHQKDLLYPGTSISNTLFKGGEITNSKGSDEDISKISALATEIVNSARIDGIDDAKLQKLSANISTVCSTSTNEEDIRIRNEKLQRILGYNKNKTFTNSEIEEIQSVTLKYYQLTQFKRVMFECTEMVHSKKDGRINKISFKAVIENDALKLN